MKYNHFLSRTQKNEAYEMIRKCGLDPASFEWQETRGWRFTEYWVHRLIHKPTGYYFVFDFEGDYYISHFSPGVEYPIEHGRWGNWENTKKYSLSPWLHRVKKEHEAPDLWSIAYQEREMLELATAQQEEQNAPFTEQEQEKISVMLGELKRYVLETRGLVEEQQEKVENGFRYVEGALARLGRVDWKNIFITFLLSLALTLSFNMDEAGEIYKFGTALFQCHRSLQTPPVMVGLKPAIFESAFCHYSDVKGFLQSALLFCL